MDGREVLLDGIQQVVDWYDEALLSLTEEQLNYHPGGLGMSVGWNAWHWYRTVDNITHLVFKREKPLWITQAFYEKLELDPRQQGTGMPGDEAAAIKIKDADILRAYGEAVTAACLELLRSIDESVFSEMQRIDPLGEMPKWRVFRQVIMTHGFMHLGEIYAVKGQMGLQGPM